MEIRKFAQIEAEVPLLGFGLMRLPVIDGNNADIDEEKAVEMVRVAMQNGVNYFDTAYLYHEGESEPFAQKALASYQREDYLLASKMPTYLVEEKADIPRFFEEQLQKCGVEYFDFYLMHALDGDVFSKMERLGLYSYLKQQKEKGRIRYLGFSFHDEPPVLEKICKAHPWDFAQIQLNYYDWLVYQSKEQYDILLQHQIPCIVMEPLHGGLLADLGEEANAILKKVAPGKSVASWAMRYAGNLPGVLCVLSGMSTLHQLQENIHTFSPLIPMREEEREVLMRAVEKYKEGFRIPCSTCRYCMPCPYGVDIPMNFSLYNTLAQDGDMQAYRAAYEMKGEQKAGKCVNCGACLEKCPQRLDIPGLFAQFDAGAEPAEIVKVLQIDE